jgi:hypothetical protein
MCCVTVKSTLYFSPHKAEQSDRVYSASSTELKSPIRCTAFMKASSNSVIEFWKHERVVAISLFVDDLLSISYSRNDSSDIKISASGPPSTTSRPHGQTPRCLGPKPPAPCDDDDIQHYRTCHAILQKAYTTCRKELSEDSQLMQEQRIVRNG